MIIHTFYRGKDKLVIEIDDKFVPQELPIKEKWLAALRSGKYEQIEGEMMTCDRNGACCLGVLADIEGVPMKASRDGEHLICEKDLVNDSFYYGLSNIGDKTGTFPNFFSVKFNNRMVISLSSLNDFSWENGKDYYFVRIVINYLFK